MAGLVSALQVQSLRGLARQGIFARMRAYKVSDLVIDMTVYPRKEVDGDHVFNIMEAMRAGVKFPPVIICKLTKRIVDGAHRVTAASRLAETLDDIDCIEKTYANDQEFFLDAIKYNASNGRNLTRDDRARIAVIGEQLKIDDRRLASTLSVSESIIGGLRAAEYGGCLLPDRSSAKLATRTRHAEVRATNPNLRSLGGSVPARQSNFNSPRSHEAVAESTRASRMIQGCIAVLGEIDWGKCEDDRLWELLLDLHEIVNEKVPQDLTKSM